MKPKYIYPIMLNFGANHCHFYLDYDEAMKDIKEHKLDVTLVNLKPGTEFCTDFDTDGNTYIRNLVTLDDSAWSIDFFVRNPLIADPDVIRWYRAVYNKKRENNYRILTMFSIIVNGHNIMQSVESAITPLPDCVDNYNAEDILKKYIREYINLYFNVEAWLEKE